ncbi:MAG: hyaluronidase [Rhizobiales bacterium]|nr:hyaluronidase [Hyphomicrobiales bacterium]
MLPELGTIEGFYGRPWSWTARAAHVTAMAPHGYGFYLYAPKADAFLRRRWSEPHPPEEQAALASLARHCKAAGVRFGVGLSPFELYLNFDETAREALARKLDALDAIGIDDLAILFDDMRGDLPGLAEKQMEIINWIAARTKAGRLIICPSYYSDDPVLDRVFGARPDDYLETLGRELDPSIDIFWTGPKVCSDDITPDHLTRVSETLKRKPFIWDNYPVNDGQRMSRFLHLRGFSDRQGMAGHITAHAVNPASQAWLSRIPMLTLEACYQSPENYDAEKAFLVAATDIAGAPLAAMIKVDLGDFQDRGLEVLTDAKKAALQSRYAALDHPCAQEIVDWLKGHWAITNDVVLTQ